MRKQTFIEKLRHFAKVEGIGVPDEYGHADYRPSVRSGPNTPGAPWQACVDMITEVTNNWDIDKLQRRDTVRIA